jgi:acyl carrier protein
MMDTSALEEDIKGLIIKTLDLEDMTPQEIGSDDPLFGDGLGLDSIDALELGVALAKHYSIELGAKSEDNHKHFASVAALARFVQEQTTINQQ